MAGWANKVSIFLVRIDIIAEATMKIASKTTVFVSLQRRYGDMTRPPQFCRFGPHGASLTPWDARAMKSTFPNSQCYLGTYHF